MKPNYSNLNESKNALIRQILDEVSQCSSQELKSIYLFVLISKQFFDLTLCNSANGGKTCIYGLFRHLLYGETIRIWWQVPA